MPRAYTFRRVVLSVFLLATFSAHADNHNLYPQCDFTTGLEELVGAGYEQAEAEQLIAELEEECQAIAAARAARGSYATFLTENVTGEYTVRGFPVYVSSHVSVSDDKEEGVSQWLDILGAVLLELEVSKEIRGYFVERLRRSGVSFYLLFVDPNSSSDLPWQVHSLCPEFQGCYLSESRVVQATHSPRTPPEWTHVRQTLIHELAHAFHDIALVDGFQNQCVLDAYRYSVERDGLHDGFYASWNHQEYFAEIVSYAMRAVNGKYCEPHPEGLIRDFYETGPDFCPEDNLLISHLYSHRPHENIEILNRWLLAGYDFNAAMLFDAFLDPRGHIEAYFHYPPSVPDPLLKPLAGEGTLDCDRSVWWPE
ncbi:MAG: hypothetical protein OXC69_08670 [Candidatus Tectomicrobia bacterium]|nr:hypothetical protein [Candidatus Tectomicrobia bacterium]